MFAAFTVFLLCAALTAGQADVTAPAITTLTPPTGATNISPLIVVRAIFSEAIQQATLTMQLRNSSSQLVAGTVTYTPATLTAAFAPAAALGGSQTYTVTVSGAKDLAGNTMASTTWSFTTATAGFQDITLPQTGLTEPTVMQFASDGRIFVAEKKGRILVYDNLSDTSPTVVVDVQPNVYDFWDRGLLGMALHPNFPTMPYIYLLYTYDAVPGGTAPNRNDDCPTPPGPTGNGCVATGRLSRFNIGLASQWPVTIAAEEPLVTDWFQQFPSHSMGSIVFGADGALYASAGEGANYVFADYGQTSSTPPSGDPSGEGGAFRSQDLRTSGDPVGLSGTVIRVDPETGAALPGNPRASDPDPNGRRIVAYGLRNPFRMTVRPGTNELWIGDVGMDKWEEIDRILDGSDATVENFGWPCYEGPLVQQVFATFGLPICQGLYNQPGAVTAPVLDWNHNDQVVAGEACPSGGSAITGLAFYPATGGTYPSAYNGALFFGDYARNCIWAMRAGAGGIPDPSTIVTIKSGAASPVQLVSGPGGDIFYVGILDNRLHRISYSGGNLPPAAVIQSSAVAGPLPLTIAFTGTSSTDPEGQTLTYAWDLDGNGTFGDSTSASPSFQYTTSSPVTVRLRVTDTLGLTDTAALLIWPGNSAPVPQIDAPLSTLVWKVGDPIAFSGRASDPEEGPLPASALSWTLVMHHCPSTCHTHTVQSFTGVASGSFAAPDHEYPSYLELRLVATDAGGLQSTTSVLFYPKSVTLSFQSSPSVMQLGVNTVAGVTPFSQDVIVGSNTSVAALSPQNVGAQPYAFSSWSDGGAQLHNLTAPATATTFTASYVAASGVPGLVAAYGMNDGAGTTTADSTGKGHQGTLVGAAWTTAGKYGGALAFNGSTSRVAIADAADLRLTTGMTIEAWVNPTTLSGWRTVLMKEGTNVISYGLDAHDNAPRPAAYVNIGGGDLAAIGTAAVPTNTWTHLAATFDGTTARLFVNGSQAGTRAAAGTLRSTTNVMSIGGNTIWGEYFAGTIDEVRVYNRALTAAEIQSDMVTPLGGAIAPDTTTPTVSMSAPAASALVRGTLTVTANASDNSGTVASVRFLLDGNPLGVPVTSAPFSASWNTTGLTGAHALSAIATDGAGNQATSATVTVTVDNTPPSVSINSPAAGAVSGTIAVSALAVDASGIASVQFLLDGANLGAADTASPYSVSWATGAVGSHTLAAIATDAAGNTTTAAGVIVTVSDTTAPTVSIASPPAGSVTGAVNIAATAADNVGVTRVQFRLDGVDFGTADTISPFGITWDTTGYAAGSAHTISAVAYDAANNATTAANVTVTIAIVAGWTPPAGLVAAYTFNTGTGTTANDVSGNNHPGTLAGGSTWTTQGRFGGAIAFDGVNALVSVPDATALDLTTDMTIEAWVRPTTLSGWRTVLMKTATGGLAYGLYAYDNAPRPAGYINVSGSDRPAAGTAAPALNTWTHLALTYDNTTLRLYVNGVQAGTRAVSGAMPTTTGALTIGGNTVWSEWFAGLIDEVRIYNRALTPAEIQAGMTQTVGGS